MFSMKTNSEEVVEEVKGYDQAVAALDSWCKSFNDCNGAGRMSRVRMETVDDEGSGEYYRAICTNIETADTMKDEMYQIVSGC